MTPHSYSATNSSNLANRKKVSIEQKNVLVTGITGAQGQAVASALLQEGVKVYGLLSTKGPLSKGGLPGITEIYADYSNLSLLTEAFSKTEIVSLVFPVLFNRSNLLVYATNVAKAAKEAGVKQLIYNASSPVVPQQTGNYLLDVKQEINVIFKAHHLPLVVLKPTVYLDNLVAPWSLRTLQTQYVIQYPIPPMLPISWSTMTDIGRYTVAIIDQQIVTGEFNVGGELTTGHDLATAFSKHLKQPIQYIPIAIEDFEKQLLLSYNATTARGIADNYRFLQANVELFQYQDQQVIEATLGLRPQTLENWLVTTL